MLQGPMTMTAATSLGPLTLHWNLDCWVICGWPAMWLKLWRQRDWSPIFILMGPILGSYLFGVEAWAWGRQSSLSEPGQISGFAETRSGPVSVIIFICTFYKRYFVSSLLATVISSINQLKCCSCFSLLLYQNILKSKSVPFIQDCWQKGYI